MLNIRNILFPTDFSDCAERAFTHAAKIASLVDAKIHAFHTRIRQKDVYPALNHLLDDLEADDPDVVAADEKTVDFPYADHDLVIQADATDSSACNAILHYTQEHDIDLIVMGSHGRRGPRRLFLGSTAECVIRNATCPVLTLRSDAETLHDEKIDHILVPVDFSPYAEEALRYTNAFAKLLGARVTLVHAIEEAVIPTVYGIEPMSFPSLEPLIDKSNAALMEMAAKFLDPSIDVSTETLIGPPAPVIADFANNKKTDMIILASHGLTGIKRFLLGSVAESLNRLASCAILTVKPFGKSLLIEEDREVEEVS